MADENPGAAPASASAPAAPAAQAPQQPAPVAPAPDAPAKRNPYAGPPRRAAAALAVTPAEAPAAADEPKPAPRTNAREAKQLAVLQAELDKTRNALKEARGEASVVETYASQELAKLTEAERAHVLKYGGKSAKAQLEKISELQALKALYPSAPAALPAPANTAPSARPAASPAASSDPDVVAARQYEQLKSQKLSMRAQTFYAANIAAISRGREKLSKLS